MDIARATPLLGGLSPRRFMQRHWQRAPLLIRAAEPDAADLVSRAQLFALAARDDVEARLVIRDGAGWTLRHGPFARRALPALARPGWSLLVQGVDLHLDAAHRLLQRFRFIPDARLDDLMLSYASPGGGVGPHVDSYDVFLLQVHGRRRWRIGPVESPQFAEAPLKILARFEPVDDWVLDPGDMLYLPPGWGHDGIAEGEAITASIGFRSAGAVGIGVEVLQQLLDGVVAPGNERRYADRTQPATTQPARIPTALQRYADASVARLVADRAQRARALGAALSEPKAGVWFERGARLAGPSALRLDRRTRMLYDARFVYLNGEAFEVAARDRRVLRRLADRRRLDARDVAALSPVAHAWIEDWSEAGWLAADDFEENRR